MKTNDSWIIFSQSYFLLAKLGCQELLHPKHEKISKHNIGSYGYNIHDLVVPILYNTKHGIEIFIKTLSLLLTGEYNSKIHDIDFLFKELNSHVQKKIKSGELKSCIRNGDKITKKDINCISEKMDKIKFYVNKYYYINILKDKIISIQSKNYDKANDIFRYPENKSLIQIDWKNFFKKFNKNGIKEIKSDIEDLNYLFNSNGYVFDVVLND